MDSKTPKFKTKRTKHSLRKLVHFVLYFILKDIPVSYIPETQFKNPSAMSQYENLVQCINITT